MYERYLELSKDYTPNKSYAMIAKEFSRSIYTVETHIKKIEENEKDLIIGSAYEKLESGEPVNLYEMLYCQKKAIAIFANVLCDSEYETGDKQFRLVLKIMDNLAKKKKPDSDKELPE